MCHRAEYKNISFYISYACQRTKYKKDTFNSVICIHVIELDIKK